MEITQVKKLKINATNIQSSLFRYNKELIKLKKDRVKLNTTQQNKLKVLKKEKFIETPLKSSIANIGKRLLSYPLSLIDKFKEFFGLILLGILVNNLPKIIKGLQTVFGKIKDFFDKNPWIVSTIKFGFKVIFDGIVALAKVIKNLRPIIGGSFKFALDTLKSTKEQIGTLISMFSDLENTSVLLMQLVGFYDPPKPKPVKPSPQQVKKVKSTPTASGGSYSPKTGYTYNPNFKNVAQATGVLAPKGGVMGTMIPGQKDTWREYGPGEDPAIYKKNVERYKVLTGQKLARGGTVRRKLGNIPPQEGTFRGGPSDIMRGQQYITTKTSPYASPGGTAKGRKARQSINSFKLFEMNVQNESRNLENQEKNYDMFGEFLSSYKILSDLRKKYKDTDGGIRRTRNAQTDSPDDYDPGEVGAFASGAYIGEPGDRDGEQTGLNMNLPGGIGTPIYAPRDLIYKTRGTNGGPSVGLQGTADALGPSGSGFGFYGAYFFKEGDKEYEVLMGHFRDMPYKGSKNGDIIPKGTLLGYQGASGRSVSSTNGVYPHISLHLNGVGFQASNQELVKFANSLRASGGTKPVSSSKPGATLSGLASFYGGPFDKRWHGRETASGQVFDENGFSTALKDGLPFGMYEVTYNDKTVLVRGNDRGNFGPGNTAGINPPKDLDLSYGAAKSLGITTDGKGGVGRITYKRVGDLKSSGGGLITKPKPSPTPTPQAKMDAQTLRTNIANLMKDLGTNKKIFGQRNLSVEIVDGKLQFKDTRGVLGTGLLQQQYSTQGQNLQLLKDVQNYLQYELNKRNEEKNKPGATALDYGGSKASNDLTIVKETVIAMVPGPPQTIPVPVDRLVPVPVSIEQDYTGFYSV